MTLEDDDGSSPIPVYSFASFEELKAAVEADPPTHDAHGLYNFVQARLQRPGIFAVGTPEDIERIWQTSQAPGSYRSTMTREEFDAQVTESRAEHEWLKTALVKLEERAFGVIHRGPALGTDVTCAYYGDLLHARVESRGRLPDGTEVFYTDVIRDMSRLVFRADMQGKRWISGRHDFNSAEARALLVASTDPSLPPPEFWAGYGEAEQQFETREAAQAFAGGDGSPIAAILAFEADWSSRVGGDAAQDVRTLIGFAMYQLIRRHGVHPRALADYLRESLRVAEPDKFDTPLP